MPDRIMFHPPEQQARVDYVREVLRELIHDAQRVALMPPPAHRLFLPESQLCTLHLGALAWRMLFDTDWTRPDVLAECRAEIAILRSDWPWPFAEQTDVRADPVRCLLAQVLQHATHHFLDILAAALAEQPSTCLPPIFAS